MMQVVILAGGLGTRLTEETHIKPKPMVEIGGQPILWHIMKYYAAFGFDRFALALGYKGEYIKDYFLNYRYRTSCLTVCTATGSIKVHNSQTEDWTVHLLDTGLHVQTGGRIKRMLQKCDSETFLLTYGDGVSNVDIRQLIQFHRKHGKLATFTAVRPPARFGSITFNGDQVVRFEEKSQAGEGWINGGFFVLEPGIKEYIEGDGTVWEREPMERLAADGQLVAYRHHDFWQCMDTLRDLNFLENLWERGEAPWKIWP